MRRGNGHVRVLIESFGNPGFLGNRDRGWAVTRRGGLSGKNRVGRRRLGGKRQDGGLEVKNGGRVGAGGGDGLGEDFKDFGPISWPELFERRALGWGEGGHGGLGGGFRLAGGNKRGSGSEREGGTR